MDQIQTKNTRKHKGQNNKKKEFNFVTIAPKQSSEDNPVLARLKSIQDQQRSIFRGLNPDEVGLAGMPINHNQRTIFQQFYDSKAQIYFQQLKQNVFNDKNKRKDSDTRPGTIQFSLIDQDKLLPEGQHLTSYSKGRFLSRSDLRYRVFKTDGRLVRSILEAHEFTFTDSHDWNILWLGSSAKTYNYEGLNDYQKINHFPNSYEITRKDRLCSTIVGMQEKYGRQNFHFIPDTYVLPDEYADFYSHFTKEKYSMWIMKPQASSQGRGISLIDQLNEVPLHQSCVICKYIHNPLLINGLKFDLRIYVAVTSYMPLRIYIYPEGLARFATEQYAPGSKNNKFMHLTNYSINKKSDKFVQNDNPLSDDIGNKWSLSALFRHLQTVGVDTQLLWSRIYDIIIKSLISIEPSVVESLKRSSTHRNSCFELFGFDVIIDSNLKPWLLEVNLSPSLATDSPLDMAIKGNLLTNLFNLAGIRNFDRKKEGIIKARNRVRARLRQQSAMPRVRSQQNQDQMNLIQTIRFREILLETLEEEKRCQNFIRIFPAKGTNIYDAFFPSNRILNMALYNVLYNKMLNDEDILPPQPIASNKMAVQPNKQKAPRSQSQKRDLVQKNPCLICQAPLNKQGNCSNCSKRDNKLIITGDDILIEYIGRMIEQLKVIDEQLLKMKWKRSIDNFYIHDIWQMSKTSQIAMTWQKLQIRLEEMLERRKKLYESKGMANVISPQKNKILISLKEQQLEDMLFKTSKNVAKELVSNLIDSNGNGILTDIIKSGLGAMSEADNGEDELESYARQGQTKEISVLR